VSIQFAKGWAGMRVFFKHTHEPTPPNVAEAMCEHLVCTRVCEYADVIQAHS